MSESKKNTAYSEQPHVLIVDDDQRICDLVSRYLLKQHYVALCANSAQEARALLGQFRFDALIVDVMMPGETGLEFTQGLKQREDLKSVPVIMLTALGEVQDRIKGFEVGVDDYLPKPFEAQELLMRLEAILRRTRNSAKAVQRYTIGDYIFEESAMALRSEDDTIKLTEVETRLLSALIDHHGAVLSREELSRICDLDGGERAIDVQVTRLRRKIEPDTKMPRYLQTVRGRGYVLRAERVDG